jgi:hypothetical protein
VNQIMTMSIPHASPQRRLTPRLTPLQWLEVAALIGVAIAITPALIGRLSQAGAVDASSLIPALTIPDSTATSLVGQPVWGAKLGDGEGGLSSTALAIRIGASIATFEVLRARADASAGNAALQVAEVLETFPGGFEAASTYRLLATRAPADSEVRAAARLAEKAGGSRVVQLGAWLQGARFAAASSDTTWFAGNAERRVSRLAITIDDRADTEHAAKQFQRVSRERPHDFTAIATSVEELLRLLGTR